VHFTCGEKLRVRRLCSNIVILQMTKFSCLENALILREALPQLPLVPSSDLLLWVGTVPSTPLYANEYVRGPPPAISINRIVQICLMADLPLD